MGSNRRSQQSDFSFFDSDFVDHGQDIRAKLEITLEESYAGSRKSITLNRGAYTSVDGSTSLQVTIPKGILEGQQIRLEGQGERGHERGRRGDLYLEIVFLPHPFFQVAGRDVIMTLPVTPWEAALGATVKVPTLGGKVELKIPAGSQSGRKLRLKGKGLSSKNQPGDQLVMLDVHIPKPVSDEQKQFYEKMARIMPFNPRKNLGV